MPGIETGAGIVGAATSSVSTALSLSEAMAPEQGFGYNLCTFAIDLMKPEGDETTKKDATLLPRSRNVKGATLATQTKDVTPDQWKLGDVVPFFSVIKKGEPVVAVSIITLSCSTALMGLVSLVNIEGFDTAIGANLAIEVSAQPQIPATSPRNIVLAIKGTINPAGAGFAHFIGAGSVRAVTKGDPQYFLEPRLVHDPIFLYRVSLDQFGTIELPIGQTKITADANRQMRCLNLLLS